MSLFQGGGGGRAMMDNITNFTVLFLKSFLIYYKVPENPKKIIWFFTVTMVDSMAMDAFERLRLKGLNIYHFNQFR